MDKYAKFILTLIAVGIIGINIHLFKGEVVSSAQASAPDDEQVFVVATSKSVWIVKYQGAAAFICKMQKPNFKTHWYRTGCDDSAEVTNKVIGAF